MRNNSNLKIVPFSSIDQYITTPVQVPNKLSTKKPYQLPAL